LGNSAQCFLFCPIPDENPEVLRFFYQTSFFKYYAGKLVLRVIAQEVVRIQFFYQIDWFLCPGGSNDPGFTTSNFAAYNPV
jgi:hypothetical protein